MTQAGFSDKLSVLTLIIHLVIIIQKNILGWNANGSVRCLMKNSGTVIRRDYFMIVIDYKDRRPIYEQVVERFQDLIVKGVIRAGEQMPGRLTAI